jgi:acyl carrier protein
VFVDNKSVRSGKIEEAFDISIPFNANDPGQSGFDMTSVAAIIDAVQGLVAQRAA